MKKTQLFLVFLLTIILVTSYTGFHVYADEKLIVTREMVGDNDTIGYIRITNKVIGIEDGAFSGLRSLKQITVDNDNEYYASWNGCLYNKDYTILICVPQNTSKVTVKASITGYTPHALDGLEQSRIDRFHELFNISEYNGVIGNTGDNSVPTEKPTETIKAPEPVVENNNIVSQPENTNRSVESSSDFSKYVYKDKNNIKCFKYTGTDDTRIIIPDDVVKVTGFSSDFFGFNTKINYIYIPSSVQIIQFTNLFEQEEFNYDEGMYSLLYQCSSLRTVESDSPHYLIDNNGVYQQLGNGRKVYQWLPNKKVSCSASDYE